jgi:hypothetical protein
MPQRPLQASDVVVDPAKMADVREPTFVLDPVADHALTDVAVDLLWSGIDHQGFQFMKGSSMIDRDVLETIPDVSLRQSDNLGFPELVDLGDRLKQRPGCQSHLFMTNSFPPGSKFVTETLPSSMPVIVISPSLTVGLVTDPITDDGLGLQQRITDLLVDSVAGEEPPQISRFQWNKLILQILENPLGIEDVEEVCIPLSV